VTEDLDPVAHEAALGPGLGTVDPSGPGPRLTGIPGVGWQVNAHAPECRVKEHAERRSFRRIPEVEEWR
jgi:hypothetical protein